MPGPDRSSGACVLDAMFTHPLLAEGLNGLFATVDSADA